MGKTIVLTTYGVERSLARNARLTFMNIDDAYIREITL